MNEPVRNRSEIVFLYDVTNANPNGDPIENKPRMDEETEINLVSDTRLKRTVRDYLAFRKKESPNLEGNEISVLPIRKEDGKIKTKGERVLEIVELHPEFVITKGNKKSVDMNKLEEHLKKTFIDLRLFGATLALGEEANVQEDARDSIVSDENKDQEGGSKKGNKDNKKGTDIPPMKWIGPVQFKFGHSLHKVEPVLLKGTTVESSGVGHGAGTFTEFWYVPYSLIAFSGIVNEVNAQDTGLTDSDVSKLLDALWNGTKGLITRSKIGQLPRFLMQVVYKGHFHVGNLEGIISLTSPDGKKIALSDDSGKSLRSISQINVDLTDLASRLKNDIKRIQELRVQGDSQVSFLIGKKTVSGDRLAEALQELFGSDVAVTSLAL